MDERDHRIRPLVSRAGHVEIALVQLGRHLIELVLRPPLQDGRVGGSSNHTDIRVGHFGRNARHQVENLAQGEGAAQVEDRSTNAAQAAVKVKVGVARDLTAQLINVQVELVRVIDVFIQKITAINRILRRRQHLIQAA